MAIVRPPEFREEVFKVREVDLQSVSKSGKGDRDLRPGFTARNHPLHRFRFTLEKCFAFIEVHPLFHDLLHRPVVPALQILKGNSAEECTHFTGAGLFWKPENEYARHKEQEDRPRNRGKT